MPHNNHNKKKRSTERKRAGAAQPDARNTSKQQSANKHSGSRSSNKRERAHVRTLRGDVENRLGKHTVNSEAPNHTTPERVPRKTQKPPISNKGESDKKRDSVVRTFKDDVQNLVRNKKMSLARMTALESDEPGKKQALPDENKRWKTRMVVAISLLLLVAASVVGLGSWYAYQLNFAKTEPYREPAIIFTEVHEQITVNNLKGREILSRLGRAREQARFSLGSIIGIDLARTTQNQNGDVVATKVEPAEFLSLIDAQVPDSFLQALASEYLLGLHVLDDETAPFVILTTASYSHGFAGMLAWEPNIESDFGSFFRSRGSIRPLAASGSGEFTDTVVQNIDVRILRTPQGETRLAYAFVDREAFIITTNVRTLLEVAKRLRVAEI